MAKTLTALTIAVLWILGTAAPSHAQGLHWAPARAVVTVWAHPDVIDAWSLPRAVRLWNDRTPPGAPTLRLNGDKALAEVIVRRVDRPAAGWVGMTYWDTGNHGNVQSARVKLNVGVVDASYSPHTKDLRAWTTLHELGHVLGVNWHTPSGIMSGDQPCTTGGWITDTDVDAVRHALGAHS